MDHNHGGLEDHFPSKWVICRFHVNLPGCRSNFRTCGTKQLKFQWIFTSLMLIGGPSEDAAAAWRAEEAVAV